MESVGDSTPPDAFTTSRLHWLAIACFVSAQIRQPQCRQKRHSYPVGPPSLPFLFFVLRQKRTASQQCIAVSLFGTPLAREHLLFRRNTNERADALQGLVSVCACWQKLSVLFRVSLAVSRTDEDQGCREGC